MDSLYEAPSSNIQAPEKLQAPNTKSCRRVLGDWCLEFLWSSVLGIWSFFMITDLKYALRMLLKAPTFTIIAILTLALWIGANSAIFSVVDTVLLRPLPFPHPDQLVMIWGTSTKEPEARETDSFPDFYDYRAQNRSFTAMAAYASAWTFLTGRGEAQELNGVAVAGDFFETVGVA